jgi:hypothetical protein
MSEFIPELQLSERFYQELVEPIIKTRFPSLSYAAALIGDGSGVLGFDTELSRDHDWGLRLQLFIGKGEPRESEIRSILDKHLPNDFLGYSIRFSKGGSPVEHHVDIYTVDTYLHEYLGVSSVAGIEPADWLTFPEERLLCLTSGKVFFDGLGTLSDTRRQLQYYPQDVWFYLLASGWRILSQEMPFIGRCGDVGDEVGSQSITARQCQRVIHLLFLIEKQYAPYSKWLGTGFKKLNGGAAIEPHLHHAMLAKTWQDRESHINEAYRLLVEAFNELKLVATAPLEVNHFYDRPYTIVDGPPPEVIQALISDNALRILPLGVGGVDQITDNVDVLNRNEVFRRLKGLYSA